MSTGRFRHPPTETTLAEGLRSAAGLGMENYRFAVFAIGAAVPEPAKPDVFLELLEMVDDLEGEIFTDTEADAARWPFMRHMTAAGMAGRLAGFDLIVPLRTAAGLGQ